MFDKLMQARQKAEEIKKRLDNITVAGEAEAGKIKVTATGNKKIQSIEIDQSFLQSADKEELEDDYFKSMRIEIEKLAKLFNVELLIG